MIIEWNAHPDNGAVGYGLNNVFDWTAVPEVIGWTTPSSIHSKCGESAPRLATRTIDENTGTEWEHMSASCNHWIIFDFSQTYSITKIRLYQSTYASERWGLAAGLKVYVSDDPGSWGSAVWTGVLNASGWQESGAFSKNGRYVKLVSETTGFGQYMFEFDAYLGTAEEGTTIPIFMRYYRNMRENS